MDPLKQGSFRISIPLLTFEVRLFFNPKRFGLFGQLRRRGQSVPFSNNGLWWPQFLFKLHKQYLIWKLTYSAKIWNLSEVIEAHSLASEGYGMTKVKMKKK